MWFTELPVFPKTVFVTQPGKHLNGTTKIKRKRLQEKYTKILVRKHEEKR
jgi:hypothetical protein